MILPHPTIAAWQAQARVSLEPTGHRKACVVFLCDKQPQAHGESLRAPRSESKVQVWAELFPSGSPERIVSLLLPAFSPVTIPGPSVSASDSSLGPGAPGKKSKCLPAHRCSPGPTNHVPPPACPPVANERRISDQTHGRASTPCEEGAGLSGQGSGQPHPGSTWLSPAFLSRAGSTLKPLTQASPVHLWGLPWLSASPPHQDYLLPVQSSFHTRQQAGQVHLETLWLICPATLAFCPADNSALDPCASAPSWPL